MIQTSTFAILRTQLETLIRQHGTLRVTRALLAALLAAWGRRQHVRKIVQRDASILPNHLRRDIGLPPTPDVEKHWRGL